VSIDTNYECDLYVSASKNTCVLRTTSTNKYFKTITPEFPSKGKYKIFKVLLSPRGYLVIQGRNTIKYNEVDILQTYSINGEKIAEKCLEEYLNAILLDNLGYFIITGGNSKKLKRFCIISLEEIDLHELIENIPLFPSTILTLTYFQCIFRQ